MFKFCSKMSVGLKLCPAVLVWPGWNWAEWAKRQNGKTKIKYYRHFRAKLKHVLQLGDLKASLRNSLENSFYNTPSNDHFYYFLFYYVFSTYILLSSVLWKYILRKDFSNLHLDFWWWWNCIQSVFTFQKFQVRILLMF